MPTARATSALATALVLAIAQIASPGCSRPGQATPMTVAGPERRLPASAVDAAPATPTARDPTPAPGQVHLAHVDPEHIDPGQMDPEHADPAHVDLGYIDMRSPRFARFREWVDRAAAGRPGYNFSPTDAAWMYRLTGQQRYCQLAIGLVETRVSEAEAAIAAGTFAPVAGNSYLEAGHAIGSLASTWSACGQSLPPDQALRWRSYADQVVWNIWNPREARWGGRAHPWTGWATDNPGNNYHYSFLAATMGWALASRNAGMLADLRERRLPALKAYFEGLPGGGSREGTGYGVSHMNLFPLYAMWRDASGEDLANANAHLTDTIAYWIHATVPTFSHYAPIGDLARYANPELYDYHRALMLHARHLSASEQARSSAAWWLGSIPVARMQEGFNLRADLLPPGDGGRPPTELWHHATGTGHLFARTGWDRDAMWLSMVAGPYEESHAHQDQGAFNLYSRDWLAVTANIWTRSGIHQGTGVHNMLRFENPRGLPRQCQAAAGARLAQQCHGTRSTLEVVARPGGGHDVRADLTPAYAGNPAVRSWRRQLEFDQRTLTVRDHFAVGPGTRAVFQLQVPVRPAIAGNVVEAGRLRMTVLEPADARISTRSWPEIDAAGFRDGWRIDVEGAEDAYLVRLEER